MRQAGILNTWRRDCESRKAFHEFMDDIFVFSNHVAVIAVLANFAGFPTLFFFQLVFSLESASSSYSMSVGACAVMEIF